MTIEAPAVAGGLRVPERAARQTAVIDGNEACADVACRMNEVCAIYPMTPSSPMAELADQWSSEGKTNIWGDVPDVIEMQSEAGRRCPVGAGVPERACRRRSGAGP